MKNNLVSTCYFWTIVDEYIENIPFLLLGNQNFGLTVQDIKVGIDRLTVEIGVAEKEVEGAKKEGKEAGNYPFWESIQGKEHV